MKKNENMLDRLLRALIGVVFILLILFWTGGVTQIILAIFTVIMFCTSITGFCPLYTVFNIDTAKRHFHLSKKALISSISGIVFVFAAGALLSIFFSKKIFFEDFAVMNSGYKQLLFDSGKEKRAESIADYQSFLPIFDRFVEKYSSYTPYILLGDTRFTDDLLSTKQLLLQLEPVILSGNLVDAHKQLEVIRATFQDIFKRNNLSLLVVSLVDFHDVMEVLISAADEKDSQKILATYPSADEKLKEVEATLNDQYIQTIRGNLETLIQSAKDNKTDILSAQAQTLKTSFIKVYLKN